ncbi:transposase [Rhodobacteraceae bacterium CCMM004]|nr:transposase [Rhodobacteraceae bacterium CCMM004]
MLLKTVRRSDRSMDFPLFSRCRASVIPFSGMRFHYFRNGTLSQAGIFQHTSRCPTTISSVVPTARVSQDPSMSAELRESPIEIRAVIMSDLFRPSDAHGVRLGPSLPTSHGRPRVHDRRAVSRIVFIHRNGMRWRDAPANDGPHKVL